MTGTISLPRLATVSSSVFYGCTAVSGVTLDAAVTIDSSAFYNCISLASVSLPVTLKTIGSSAFYNCTSLASVSLPTSLTTIGSYAFQNCTAMKTFRTPSSLNVLATKALANCTRLETVEIDGDNLRVGKSVFSGCSSLRTVTYGEGVAKIEGGIIPGSSSLASPSYSFAGCSSIESIVVRSPVVRSIPEYFCGASSLTTLSFAGTITNIGYNALCNCSGLTTINATLRPVAIGYNAFLGCINLNPSVDFSDCTSIGSSAFSGCRSMTGSLSLPKLSTVSSSAFYGCSKIESVQFGDGLTSIGSSAFSGCTNAFTFAFAGTPPSVGSSAFNKVKSGAIGTYTAAYKTAWDAVINANGTWNGLIMSANKPVLSNGGCNVATGSFTLTWANDDVLMPPGMKYEIRRGFSDNYGASEVLTNGYDQLSFVDKDFYTTGGVSQIWYWIKPEHPLFEASEPIVTRTRHAIIIGLSSWDGAAYEGYILEDTGGAAAADKFDSLATRLGGFNSVNVYKCVDSNATSNKVSNAFSNAATNASPGDICVFFINTHGGIFENGTSYLCLYDGRYTEMQLAQDISRLDPVKNGLAVIGIVSACHSGALFNNPDQSVSRTSWYLRNNLAQCSANVAWITSSGAATSGFPIFKTFLLEYGWEDGWAGTGSLLTFAELANYTKNQYDGLFSGIVFEDETESKKVQIENDLLLSLVVAGERGSHLAKEAPGTPSNPSASRGTDKTRIRISWDAVADADEYWVFYRYGSKNGYTDVLFPQNRTYAYLEIHSNNENEYADFCDTDEGFPALFVVKAFNGAGVSAAEEIGGWVDSTWEVAFFAGDGSMVGNWMGEQPQKRAVGDDYPFFIKTMNKHETLTLTSLPQAVRDGYTCARWLNGNQAACVGMVLSNEVQFVAEWTAMTTNWLNQHQTIANAANGDIATAAAMTAANGCRTVGECYALGIDPEDPNDDLKITDFKIEDGKPVITLNHTKDGLGNSFESRIKTLGKANLTDADWVDVTDKDQSAYRFFKVKVDMP